MRSYICTVMAFIFSGRLSVSRAMWVARSFSYSTCSSMSLLLGPTGDDALDERHLLVRVGGQREVGQVGDLAQVLAHVLGRHRRRALGPALRVAEQAERDVA